MTTSEKIKKIEEIYSRTMQKMRELEQKQQVIIREYMQELEQEKIKALKDELQGSL